jgi:hypothetical protein
MTSPLSKINLHTAPSPGDSSGKEELGALPGPLGSIEDGVQLGHKKVQAIREGRVWGRKSTIWLWAGMFLLHFSQAFEGSTTFLYIP